MNGFCFLFEIFNSKARIIFTLQKAWATRYTFYLLFIPNYFLSTHLKKSIYPYVKTDYIFNTMDEPLLNSQ